MKYYEISLPMPISVNASKDMSGGFWNPKTKKYQHTVVRSKEHSEWIANANKEWRRQFPRGVAEKFRGRIRVVYVFVWPLTDQAGVSSDIGNREKALSDFVQGKFFENDNQIDEQRQFRRLWGNLRPYAWVRIYEIPDKRATDPALCFSGVPAKV